MANFASGPLEEQIRREEPEQKSLVERLDTNKAELRLGLRRALQRIEELEEEVESLREDFDMMECDRHREREKVAALKAENARLREEKKAQANTILAYQGRFGYTRFGEDLRRRAEEMVEELDDWSEGPDTHILTSDAANLIRELAGLEGKDEV